MPKKVAVLYRARKYCRGWALYYYLWSEKGKINLLVEEKRKQNKTSRVLLEDMGQPIKECIWFARELAETFTPTLTVRELYEDYFS